jgi:hypothetical protein
MIRYPLGGMMSYVLQYLEGFRRLGHDVWFVERAAYPDACFDPQRNVMGNDSSFGLAAVDEFLTRFDLGDSWCFVDYEGRYFGIPRVRIEEIFRTADVFIDMGTHGAWSDETELASLRVLIDGEPGFNQIKMDARRQAGDELVPYDAYYTNGMNVGTDRSPAPTAGVEWGHVFHPVVTDLFEAKPLDSSGPFTTVMNWQSHASIEHDGRIYGQKDMEFSKFRKLPERVGTHMEIAVAGRDVPREALHRNGWRVRDAHGMTATFDSYRDYIHASLGEFSVCKNIFVDMNTGWFSDRSAAYLAAGRPVVLQETGFSDHLPVGQGLFAVITEEDAVAAIDEILADPDKHSATALDVACEHLEARVVLRRFLSELGIE